MAEFVSVQSSGGLATIRLDRPPVNALSIALQGELRDAAEQVGADPDIRAVVIYGGEKVFAAGADVKEMAARSYAETEAVSRRLHASFRAVAGIGKPVVAAITGVALGGGLELALCADFRVAGENARFGVPEILLGVIPGLGGTQRLPRLIGPARAKDLVYTGRFVDSEEALPGTTLTRYCASSLQTTRMAAHAIRAGEGQVFISAGMRPGRRLSLRPPPESPWLPPDVHLGQGRLRSEY